MKIAFLFPLALAAVFSPVLADSTDRAAKPSAEAALTILKAENEESSQRGLVSRARAEEIANKFFSSVDIAALTPQQIGEAFRQIAFSRGDRKWAREAMETLRASSADRGPAGALSLALQGLMFGIVQGTSQERELAGAALRDHPAFVESLNGDYGDLVLAAACKGLPEPGKGRNDALVSVADRLDVSRPGPASSSVQSLWEAISGQKEKPVPATLAHVREHLVAYLDAALKNSTHPHVTKWKERIASTRDMLNGAAARDELIGFPAPELNFLWANLPDLKVLSQLKGKVVVLDFWAIWCQPCVEGFPEMRQLQERYRNHDVVFLGVTSLQNFMFDEKGAAIRCDGDPEKETRLLGQFIKHKNITWPVAVSREPVFNPNYGIKGIPTMAIVAPDGVVKFLFTTDRKSTEEKVKMIDALLIESGKPAPKA